jgi:hypothetical protein
VFFTSLEGRPCVYFGYLVPFLNHHKTNIMCEFLVASFTVDRLPGNRRDIVLLDLGGKCDDGDGGGGGGDSNNDNKR